MKLKPKQRAFLAVFTELGNVRLAAQLAKVARRSHYYWLKEPEYAAAFADAREEAYDRLKPEARRRAVGGVEEGAGFRPPAIAQAQPGHLAQISPDQSPAAFSFAGSTGGPSHFRLKPFS